MFLLEELDILFTGNILSHNVNFNQRNHKTKKALFFNVLL